MFILSKKLDIVQEMWYSLVSVGQESNHWLPCQCPVRPIAWIEQIQIKSVNTTFGLYVEGYDPSFVCDEFCNRI